MPKIRSGVFLEKEIRKTYLRIQYHNKQEQEQDRSPDYTSPTPIQFKYVIGKDNYYLPTLQECRMNVEFEYKSNLIWVAQSFVTKS